MTVLSENLDYTDKDFDSIVHRMNNLVRQVFPDWTDVEASNFGNTIKGLFGFAFDNVSFYMDNQAKESRLTDVELRKNAIAIAKMLAFIPARAEAATADLLVSLNEVPANDVSIAAGHIVRTSEVDSPVEFQFLADLVIPAGTNPPQAFAVVEHSRNLDEEFLSNGLADQEFTLAGVPYLDDSLVLFAANGVYEVVDSYLDSSAVDRHVTILVDENDRATLRFGNGVNGEIPVGLITALYKTGGGDGGNVEANTINRITGSFTDALGNPVVVTVNNPSRANGGHNRMTVEEIKLRGPQSTRVSDRTVALEDYTIGAEALAGVARALMLTADQMPGLPENRGFLYVVPEGGGVPTQTLKDQVLTAVTVTKPNTVTFRVEVKDPIYATFDIAATVYLKPGILPATAGAAIRANLTEFFRISNSDGTPNEKIGFGFSGKQADGSPAREIPLIGSVLAGVITDNTGVRKVGDRAQDFTINGSHEDAPLEMFEFPILGSVLLVDGDTGAAI